MRIKFGRARVGKVFLTGSVALACAVAPSATASAAVSQYQSTSGLVHICHSSQGRWRLANRLSRNIESALRYRRSTVGIRVVSPHLGITCWLHADWHFYSASAVKATILAALLLKVHTEHRSLTTTERYEAWRMITRSDNAAANYLWSDVGRTAMQRFLDEAGMTRTYLPPPYKGWGLTRITALDQTRLLWVLMRRNRVLPGWMRRYELRLMANVVSYQRWGVSAGMRAPFTLHIKNGWANLPALTASDQWTVNSIGAFTGGTGGSRDYSIVVLTGNNGTTSEGGLDYGITTIQRVAVGINREIW